MATTTTDKELLRSIPLFAKLNDAEREGLTQLLKSRSYTANEPIFWLGEVGDEMFIVQRGQVRLSYVDEAGQDIVLAIVGPGAFFGELSLLDGGPRTATARAKNEAVLLSLDRKNFYDFLEKNGSAAVHVVATIAHRSRENLEKLRGVKNVNQAVEESVTPLQRLVDMAAAIGASGIFLVTTIVFIITWMVSQTVRYEGTIDTHDAPPTFFWLGYMITVASFLLTVFVLNSQKRQAERDRIRNDMEYQVNLKAQVDVTELHRKVDRLAALLGEMRGSKSATGQGMDEPAGPDQ